MRKIFLSLFCGLMLIPFVTGCGNKSNEEKPNFEVIQTKVKYIVVKDKKIYLAKNVKDFVLQFKGLGCTYTVSGYGSKEVDSMDYDDEMLGARTSEIKCYTTENKKWTEQVNMTMHTYTSDQGDIYDIYYWSFSMDDFDVVTDNGTVLFGDTNREDSTLDEALKVFGDDYTIEEDSYSDFVDYIYEDGDFELKFSYNKDDDYISGFYISR